MAGEDEAGEDLERAPRAERQARHSLTRGFGRRRFGITPVARGAKRSAALASGENVIRSGVDLASRESMALYVVWIGTFAFAVGLHMAHAIAFRSWRPLLQFDLPFEYYGVLYAWRQLAWLGFLTAVVAPFLGRGIGLRNAGPVVALIGWLGICTTPLAQYLLAGAELQPVATVRSDDARAFSHPWCKAWRDAKYDCEQSPRGLVRCAPAVSARQVSSQNGVICTAYDAPSWCVYWSDGVSLYRRLWPFDWMQPFVGTYYEHDGGLPALVSIDGIPVRSERKPARCLLTILGSLDL